MGATRYTEGMAEGDLLFDRYRMVRKLGSGAFATVYLADDLKMGRPVAVKVVEHTADVEDRVVREAQAAAKLNHPHILTVYEMIRQPERTFLMTEYIQGKTLRELYREQALTDSEILEIGVQLSRALEHAHKRGVVHRDIKPENVMLLEGDSIDVRLMDFGVAQLEDRASITLDGDLVGTLAYMSPEQGEGKNVDSRSDVYSLALTLYEGFTGKNPLKGAKLQELLRDVSRPEIPALSENRRDLPLSLSDALERAMVRDSYARPDAATFGRILGRAAKELPEEEVPEERLATRVRERLAPTLVERDRLIYLGEHLASGVFALASLLYVLPRVPFYPEAAVVPLVAVASFLALLWPFGGAVLTLALPAPPIFAFGAGWGVVYLVPAIATLALLRWRGREWAALLPGAVPFAIQFGMGLVLLPLAGAIARRWGALLGFLSGMVLLVTAGLAGWESIPYSFNPGSGAMLRAAEHAASPWTVLLEIARWLDSRPELALQLALFTIFSLPWYALWGGSAVRRMWGMSTYLIALFLAFVLGPILGLEVPVVVGPFLVTFAPCAIIGFLIAFLVPSERVGTL
ncbi:MAG: serine/threonine protein kinase [Actinobacteria bacterium]|nr:serine/threonine protein kinase [Actinomycetota bacterium]